MRHKIKLVNGKLVLNFTKLNIQIVKTLRRNIISKKNDRIVYRNQDGDWINKKINADKASSKHDTQKEAQDAARQMLKNQGAES